MTFEKVQIPWNKRLTKETDARVLSYSKKNKGKHRSEEFKKRMSESHKGKIPWNKGKKGSQVAWNKGKHGIYTPEQLKRMSESHKGKKLSEAHRRNLMGRIPWNKGISKKFTLTCKICKKKFEVPYGHIDRIYCSVPCVHKDPEWKKKNAEGVKNAWSNLELRKRQSGSHKGRHLSSRTEFKKGATPWIKGKHHSEKSREKMREFRSTPEAKAEYRRKMLEQFKSGDFPKVENTKPERQVKEELLKRGYIEGKDFIHQYKFMNKFMCDFGFLKQKVVVEINGDYWHCNPKIYPYPKNQQQIKGIRKDKAKEAYITTVDNHSWKYITLWENDIKKDVVKCVDVIEQALKKAK